MKKHLLLFFVSAMVFLTSCGSRADNSMTIRPSEFSEQTQTVLEIIGDDINFYDYTVEETMKKWTEHKFKFFVLRPFFIVYQHFGLSFYKTITNSNASSYQICFSGNSTLLQQ